MRYLAILLLAGAMTSCGTFNKSEESVVLTIDTASMIKGRTIHADISVNSDDKSEYVSGKR